MSSPPARSAVLVPPVVVAHWPCVPASVRSARHDLRAVLADWGLADLSDAAELVLSELLTNALSTSAGEQEIGTRYEWDAVGVRLEITDGSPIGPEMRKAGPEAENGRGLALVDAVTGGRWGSIADPLTGGKRVWAHIPENGGTAIPTRNYALGLRAGRKVTARVMVTVPYISAWSEETSERPSRVLDFLGRVAYHPELPTDRDEHGVLWTRITQQPGQGDPQLGKVHSLRQREVMRELRCQVCAGPADRNENGVLFLVHDDRGGPDHWPGWPDDMAAVHPPVCLPCARKSVHMCPHLKTGFVAVRVKHCPVVGVYGALYDPRNPHRPLADGIVSYDHPEIRWTIASQLVRTLRGCRIVDLENERASARGSD